MTLEVFPSPFSGRHKRFRLPEKKNGYTDRREEELISRDDRVFLRLIIVGLRQYDYPFFWTRITVVLLLAKVPVPDECRHWVGSDVVVTW